MADHGHRLRPCHIVTGQNHSADSRGNSESGEITAAHELAGSNSSVVVNRDIHLPHIGTEESKHVRQSVVLFQKSIEGEV